MNIFTQSCGFVLLVLILFFYLNQKKLKLNTRRAFLKMYIWAMLCLALDISSIVAINYANRLPSLLVEFICKSYLMSLVAMVFMGLFYIMADLRLKQMVSRRMHVICKAAEFAGIACIYLLPINYYLDENFHVYSYGASVLTTYVLAFLVVVSIFVLIFVKKKDLNYDRFVGVLTWMCMWTLAAVIQFFRNDLLIIGFAGALGMVTIYIKLENPGLSIDKQTGLFNQAALADYLQDCIIHQRQFAILSITFDMELIENDVGPENQTKVWNLITSKLKMKKVPVFRKSEDEVVLVFGDVEQSRKLVKELYRKFHSDSVDVTDVLSMKTFWMYIKDDLHTFDVKDIYFLMNTVHHNNYREKAKNNFIHVDKKMIESIREERMMVKRLETVLTEHQAEVFYQPIFSVKQQKFTTAEALVRIRDEEGNIIAPGRFIPVAEKNGQIIRLGEQVFEQVCAFLSENHLKDYGIEYIEINLSTVQCADPYLAEKYIRIIENYQIKPEQINLEITESASVHDKKILLDNMKRLMKYGVHFSLDDFGTGQSNLNYIVDMPVNVVKFDRDMTNAYFENKKAKYVMDAAMHMVQGMELEIVSEGIETKEQYEKMKDLNISYIQGYYFSKPLPAEEYLEFITECQDEEKLAE